MTVTDEQITALRAEAVDADDDLQVALCDDALANVPGARAACARVIADAAAEDEDWRRERAMQAGMAFGCDGYNDEMGY